MPDAAERRARVGDLAAALAAYPGTGPVASPAVRRWAASLARLAPEPWARQHERDTRGAAGELRDLDRLLKALVDRLAGTGTKPGISAATVRALEQAGYLIPDTRELDDVILRLAAFRAAVREAPRAGKGRPPNDRAKAIAIRAGQAIRDLTRDRHTGETPPLHITTPRKVPEPGAYKGTKRGGAFIVLLRDVFKVLGVEASKGSVEGMALHARRVLREGRENARPSAQILPFPSHKSSIVNRG